ncbi:pentapeptide repeat-containing protein [Helicobacter colisuis]|uniref:pentapeptide repeat-containing protein n=1 Tax=Helicobacter colisuis TaxID=2949739 RepID=UPI00202A18BA|nr:pentapeptide repeat-containing protein [Helicobacter colisuis]MCL9822339.1 pentapeptide repeat-containing protein [Helicobacter colisuis]
MKESSQAFDLEQISNNIQTLCESFNTQPTNVTWNQLRNYFEIKNITIDSLGIYQFGYAQPLCFKNCIFNCEIRDTRGLSLPIKQPISFLNCTFKKDVLIFNFYFDIVVIFNCVFESKCYFDSSVFNKFANFGGTTFNYVSFEGSTFNDDVSFYGATFQQPPNFSQVRFKGSLNAVNTEMLFQEQDLKNTIKKAKEKYDTESNVDKSLIYFINDFRDSFRNLKNALIKDNNLLDASNFHKYELYSKEIELDSKENKTIKDKVEKWQLWFYRKLCDHHTDLVLNLKWLVYTIALYVLLLGKIPFVYPVAIFVFCVYVYMCSFKNIWLVVSSAIVFITILNKPKIILGISNLFGENLNLWQNFITTLYVIAIGLVLFSLQKTARKNSIVPN